MIKCALSPEQLEKLALYNIVLLKEKVANNEPLDLKAHLTLIYNQINEKLNDPNTALDYARISAIQVFKSATYLDSLDTLKTDLNKLKEIYVTAKNPDTGLEEIGNFLGLKKEPVKVKEAIKKGNQIKEKKDAEEVEVKISKVNKRYRLKPTGPLSTTINELLIEGSPENGKDPQAEFFANFVRVLSPLLNNSKKRDESGGIKYGNVRGGIFLSMIPLSRIPEDQRPSKPLRSDYVYVVTDKDGNFVQFDDQYKPTNQGKVIYFSTRPVPRIENGEYKFDEKSYTQSPETIAAIQDRPVEIVKQEIKEEYDQLKKMHTFLGKYPNQHLLFSIQLGSLGGADTTIEKGAPRIKPSSVVDIVENVKELVFDVQVGKPWSISFENYPSQILINTNKVSRERVEMLVKMFTNSIEDLNAYDKAQFLRDLLFSDKDASSKKKDKDLYWATEQGVEKGYRLMYKNEEIFFMDTYGNPDFTKRSKEETEKLLTEAFSKSDGFDRKYRPVFGFITRKIIVAGVPQFNDIILTDQEDGTVRAERKPMSSIDYMDMVTNVVANVGEDGKLIRYNPYFNTSLMGNESRKLEFGPVEEETIEEEETDAKAEVARLRAEEQAEYDAMSDPNDQAERAEIYDEYDKLITPLLEKTEVTEEVKPVKVTKKKAPSAKKVAKEVAQKNKEEAEKVVKEEIESQHEEDDLLSKFERSSAALDFLRKQRGLDSLIEQKDIVATAAQIAEAKKWWDSHPLSKQVGFKEMFEAMNPGKKTAIATWTRAGITLYKGADYSDVYHEAWHAFTQLFMTKEQKSKLYNELRKTAGSFKSYRGRVVEFSNADVKELEEYLAQDFRNFMLTGKPIETAPVRNSIFQWLLNLLKSLFGQSTNRDIISDPRQNKEIARIYNALALKTDDSRADFAQYTFNEANVDFSILESNRDVKSVVEETNVVIARNDAKLLSQSIDGIMIELIDTMNKRHNTKAYSTLLFTLPEARSLVYEVAHKRFTESLKNTIKLRTESYERLTKLNNDTKPTDKKALKDYLEAIAEEQDTYDRLNYKANLLSTALSNFGDSSDLDNPKGVIKYHMDFSDLIKPEDRFFNTEVDTAVKNEFDRFAGNERSIAQLASPSLIYSMKAIYQFDKEGEPSLNELGFKYPANFATTRTRILNVTEGASDALDIYTKLAEAAQFYPALNQFVNRIGEPSNTEDSAIRLWADIEQTLLTVRIGLRMIRTEQITKVDEGNETYQELVIRQTKSTAEYKKIGQAWNKSFQIAEGSDIIDVNDAGINSLNLGAIYQKYKDQRVKEVSSVTEKSEESFPIDVAYEFLKDIVITIDESPLAKKDFELKGFQNLAFGIYKTLIDGIYNYNNAKGEDKTLLRDPESNPIVIKKPEDIFADYRAYAKENFQKYDNDGNLIAYSKKEKEVVNNITKFLSGARKNWNRLQEFQLMWSDEYSDTMVTNASGNLEYERSQRSTLTQEITKINRANNTAELTQDSTEQPVRNANDLSMNHFSKNRNPWMKSSYFMSELFNEAGRRKEYKDGILKAMLPVRILLENHAGYQTKITQVSGLFNSFGIDSAGSDEITKRVGDFIFMLEYGAEEATRHADKATTPLIKLENGKTLYVGIDEYVDDDLLLEVGRAFKKSKGPYVNTFNEQVLKYIASEYERIQKLKQGDPSGNALVGSKPFKEVGNKFVVFNDLLKLTLSAKEISELTSIDGITDYDGFLEYLKNNIDLRNKIEEAIDAYRLNITDEFTESFKKTGVLNNPQFRQWVFTKGATAIRNVSDSLINGEDFLDYSEKDSNVEAVIDAVIAAYVTNSWLHKFEVTSMFYGDPALYTSFEDFFKRNAGVHATGDIPVTTEAMVNKINTMTKKNSFAEKSGLAATEFSKTMNTAIMEDVKTRSIYLDKYLQGIKKIEKERLTKKGISTKEIDKALDSIEKLFNEAYGEMKEGDGQGYITFDAYRQLLKSLNKWTNEQEKSYIKILNGEDVKDVTRIFPVKKLQYWGTLLSQGMPVRAFHKFSLLPLVPNAIKGTDLEKLHYQMMKDKISYSTYLSGSKLNTMTKNGKVDKFFVRNDRSTSDLEISKKGFKFTPNTIFLDYLKDQLEVNDYYKGVVTFSSQMRKLVIRGMFENGIPVDWKPEISNPKERLAAWSLIKDKDSASPFAAMSAKFNDVLEKLVEIEKNKIREKVGGGKNFKKLVEFIKKELRQPGKDLSDNELDYIDIDIEGKKLLRDLELSPSANLIEKALTNIAQKKILNQKLNGEALTQVSGVGFQAPGKFKKPTLEEEIKYGTGGLRFYDPVYDENGNVVSVSSMQVKIPMQGEFKALLKDKEVLTKAAENPGMTPLQALNALIKDDAWISKPENKKKVTMVGVRIPVQGLNSMEVMEVAEFLPETSGPILILPSEIVAKSGGDFDIDKMFTLFPSFYSKESTNQKAYDELSEEMGYTITKQAVERVLALQTRAEESGMDILTDEDMLLLRKLEYYDLSEISVEHRYDKSKSGLQNELIDVLSNIILDPKNFSTLVTPNTTALMKGLAKDMAALTRDDDSKYSHLNIFETERNIFKQQSNNIGKTVLGIIAVVNTFNSIFGRAGLILEPTRVITEVEGISSRTPVNHRQKLLLDHNEIDGRISLSNLFDYSNINKIEDLISQLINGSVDVAKDAWLFDIQGNKEAINSLLFLIMAGVPAKKAIYFISQPIIREYIAKQREYRSNFSHLIGKYSKGEENMFRINARNEILFDPKYGFDLNKNDFISKNSQSDRPEKGLIFKKLQEIADSVDFNNFEKLEKNIKDNKHVKETEGTDTFTNVDRAVFAHFLEIQEMANQVTQLTQSLNFDRSKTIDMLEARIKTHKLDELSNGISQETIDKIINDSPVASYKTNDFILELFGRNAGLFGLRDNSVLVDYIIKLTEKDASGIPPITALARDADMDEADYITAFKNNIINYLFQKSIYDYDTDATEYKGYPIVKQDAPLERGVFIKNGKIYMSPESIKDSFIDRSYESQGFWSKSKAAKLKMGIFDIYSPEDGLKLYTKFLIDRELIMNQDENSFKNISKTKEFKKYAKDLKKLLDAANVKRSPENQITAEKAEIEARAYQMVIRDKALDQSNLHGHMFFGEDSYASKVMQVISKHPELRKAYPILTDLETETDEQEFEREDEALVVRLNRLKFKSVKPETSVLDDFADNLLSLSDPSVRKVKNKAENAAISELFSKFGTYVMLQTGMNTSSPFSMIRAVPSTMLYDTLADPYNKFLQSFSSKSLKDYQIKFDKQISKENPLRGMFLNYESIDISVRELGEKVIRPNLAGIKTYTGKITELDKDQVFVFGSNPLGINGNTEKGTGGAALVATKKGWVKKDEIMDNTTSSSGHAYGIVTVTAPGAQRSLSPEEIIDNIKIFYKTAKSNPDFNYLVAYSAKDKNLNGYTAQEMADMFSAAAIPGNVVFEKGFANLLTLAEKKTGSKKLKVDYITDDDVIEFNKMCISKK